MNRILQIALLAMLAGCSEPEPSAVQRGSARQAEPSPPAVVDEAGAAMLREVADLHRRGRLREGLARVEAELARDPERPRLYYNLGVFRGSLGDHEGAAEAFSAELDRYPDHLASHRALASAYSRLSRLEESLPHFEACLEAAPEDAACAFQLGRNLSSLGLFEDAEPYLEQAAGVLRDADSYAELGMLRRRRGKLENAAAAFAKALTADPKHLTTLINYGQTLLALGRAEDGEALLEQHRKLAALGDRLEALERSMDAGGASAAALLDLGGLHLERDDETAAVAAYEQALELDARNPIAALELASLYLEDGRLVEAERCIDLALAADPRNPAPLFYRGLLQLKAGDGEAAERSFAGSLERGGWPPSAYLDLGSAYRRLGDPENAATAYLEALGLDRESATGHLGLAGVRRRQGDSAGAEKAVRRALELDPGDAGAWTLLGTLRFEAGDREGAEAAFRQVIATERLMLLADDGAERLLADFPGTDAARGLYRQVLSRRAADAGA